MVEERIEDRVVPAERPYRWGTVCSVCGCEKLAMNFVTPIVSWAADGYVARQAVGPRYAFCDDHYYDEDKGRPERQVLKTIAAQVDLYEVFGDEYQDVVGFIFDEMREELECPYLGGRY